MPYRGEKMFVLGNFINALATCLNIAITILWWLIIVRALISWVNPDPFNPIVQFLYKTTEPFLIPFKRIFPIYNIGIDISPIFAILALVFIRYFLVRTLFELAQRMR